MAPSRRERAAEGREALQCGMLELLRLALSTAGDRSLDRATRFRASGIVANLLPHVDVTERLLATALAALGGATDSPWVAGRLAEAVALGRSRDRALRASLLRVLARAHAEGRHQSVVAVLVPSLGVVGVAGAVPAEWLGEAARDCDGWEFRMTRLLRRWTRAFGAGHPGIRAVVHELPHLLDDLPLHLARALHAAEPTARGWRALARLASARGEVDVLGVSFAQRGAEAVQALRETRRECDDDGLRAVMEGWLSEIRT